MRTYDAKIVEDLRKEREILLREKQKAMTRMTEIDVEIKERMDDLWAREGV